MKKIYAILASFIFLSIAGSAFAASPAIQLTGYTPISNTQAKVEAFYSLGDAQSLDLYFYWDNICGVFGNQSSVYKVTASSGYISHTINVPTSGTYCYKVSGMAHYSNGTSDFIDAGSPSSKEFKTLNSSSTNTTSPAVQNTGATSVTSSSVLLNAYYTSGNASPAYIYFMYGPQNVGAIYKSSEITQSALNGDVATTVTGLSAGTTYVYRAYVRTSYGTANATNTGTFTTLGTNNTNTCVINSFYSDSSSISYGSSTTLRWNTSNCSSASISNFGSVSTTDSRSTGNLYSNTTYTLNVYGNGSDSRTITVSVGNNNNNNNYNYPSCYYNNTCYWNGSSWIYYNNNNNNSYNNQPSCYYSNQCYWNGYSWIYYNNNNNNSNTYTGNYPSCYYSAQCYWSGTTWIWNNGGNVSGNYDAYSYNPHTPYTGGPNYIYRTVTTPAQVVYTNPVYNYGYTDIMSRYSPDYRYTDVINRTNLVGAAGTRGEITLIGLLIALIIIAVIVYLVKSSQEK